MAKKNVLELLNACSTLIVALCTVAITVFTWQTTKLSEKTAIANQDPVVNARVIWDGEHPVQYEISNESSFAIRELRLSDRLYSATRDFDPKFENPIGEISVVPAVEIARLNSSASRQINTPRLIPKSKIISEIQLGKRIAILELDLSFQSELTRKNYSQSQRFVLLPSEVGLAFVPVGEQTLWAIAHFDRTK